MGEDVCSFKKFSAFVIEVRPGFECALFNLVFNFLLFEFVSFVLFVP